MPLYDYKCETCKKVEERIAKIDEDVLVCDCGGKQRRQFHGQFGINMGPVGAYGYFDDNLGTYIHTNAQRRQVMRDQGVEERFGKGWY